LKRWRFDLRFDLEDLEFKQKWGFEIWPNDLNPFAERFEICPSLLHTVLMAIFSGEHGLANSPFLCSPASERIYGYDTSDYDTIGLKLYTFSCFITSLLFNSNSWGYWHWRAMLSMPHIIHL